MQLTNNQLEAMAFNVYSHALLLEDARQLGLRELSGEAARECVTKALQRIKRQGQDFSDQHALINALDEAVRFEVRTCAACERLNPAFYSQSTYSVHEGCDL